MQSVKLTAYIVKKLLWARQFSRGQVAIYEGRNGKYFWHLDTNEVFFDDPVCKREFIGYMKSV